MAGGIQKQIKQGLELRDMYEQEKINPYEAGAEKAKQVEQMFDNIAPTYDKLNHRLSWDIDKGWRRKAIRQLEPFAPQKLLDIATGTGDFAIFLFFLFFKE